MAEEGGEIGGFKFVTAIPAENGGEGLEPGHDAGERFRTAVGGEGVLRNGEGAGMRLFWVLSAKNAAIELSFVGLETPLLGFVAGVEQELEAVGLGIFFERFIDQYAMENGSEAGGDIDGAIHCRAVGIQGPVDLSKR